MELRSNPLFTLFASRTPGTVGDGRAVQLGVVVRAIEDLALARSQALVSVSAAVEDFREVFTKRERPELSPLILERAWKVHNCLTVLRKLDAALEHLQAESATLRPATAPATMAPDRQAA